MKTKIVMMIVALFGVFSTANANTENLRENEPVAAKTVTPHFPYVMANRGIDGEAVIRFRIDEEGRVRNARVEDYSHREFADSALNAIRRWRFEPVEKNGQTVEREVRLPFHFRSTDS